MNYVASRRVTSAATRDLVVDAFSKGRLCTLRFGDEDLTLDKVGVTSALYPYSLLALSHDKKVLYGTASSAYPPGSSAARSIAPQPSSATTHSAVHETAFSPNSGFLYLPDTPGDALWTHDVDPETGAVEFVAKLPASPNSTHLCHAVVHPGGRYLYVMYEGSSEVA
ncbi:hypothetical protein DL764_001778 [Monosporascus ibericus]|uniref:Uncharacterized protein n=1 Tax=Monosporascus ibericus TaxID=155417 RepID=A0A4Q4TSS3_9PEZI|nr:hypothetical protein DL764_001778 [Monosporascus ibericus]